MRPPKRRAFNHHASLLPSRSSGGWLFLWEAIIPRDAASNYSLPPSYFAQAGQTIRTEQHNPPLEDIAQALTGSLARDGRGGMVGPLNMGTFPIRNLAPGENASDAATVGQAGVPIGSLVDWTGDAAPAGWFLCHGQAVSRTAYASLFAVCGTKFGAGDGTTTFNLPDCRGRASVGSDNMGGTDAGRLSSLFGILARTIGGVFGAATHTLSEAEMPSHAHPGVTAPAGAHAHTYQIVTGFGGGGNGAGPSAPVYSLNATSAVGDHAHAFTTNSAGSSGAHPNVQPVIVLNKIIKATI